MAVVNRKTSPVYVNGFRLEVSNKKNLVHSHLLRTSENKNRSHIISKKSSFAGFQPI